MSLSVHEVPISEVQRSKHAPFFDFVERAIPLSKAYQIEGGGYFIVAPSSGLLPGFVIETSIPDIATLSRTQISDLTTLLNEKSSGFLWFDDDDLDSFYLIWKARLVTRASTPMFKWQTTGNTPLVPSSTMVKIETTQAAEEVKAAIDMLTITPIEWSGRTAKDVNNLAELRGVHLLKVAGEAVGAITTFNQPDDYVTVSGEFVKDLPLNSERASLAADVLEQLSATGKTVLVGMPNTAAESFAMVSKLAMPLVKRGWIAQLGSF